MNPDYQCDICHYVYQTSVGCQEEGIEAGTAWQDIPDDWVCPECGAPKKLFTPVE